MLGRATFDVDEEGNKLDWGFEEIKRVRKEEEFRKNRKMKVAKHFSGEGEDIWLLSLSHATLSVKVPSQKAKTESPITSEACTCSFEAAATFVAYKNRGCGKPGQTAKPAASSNQRSSSDGAAIARLARFWIGAQAQKMTPNFFPWNANRAVHVCGM